MHKLIDRKRIVDILEYIVAMCIILNTHTVWFEKQTGKQMINLVLIILCLTLLIVIRNEDIIRDIINKKSIKSIINNKDYKNTIYLATLFVISNIIFIIFNGNETGIKNFIEKFIILIPLFMIYFNLNNNEIKSNSLLLKISNIIVLLAAISLFFYIFGSCLDIIPHNYQIILDWGGPHYVDAYYGLHYDTQITWIKGIEVIRNTGVYNEAASHSINLCIALMIQMFYSQEDNKFKQLLLIITIFTTLSVTGIGISIILILVKLLGNKSKINLSNKTKKIIIPTIIICLVGIGIFFVKDKIVSGANNPTSSVSIRIDDYKIAFKAWKDNILIGHGYGRHDITEKYMSEVRGYDTGGSNGFVIILPQGGLYLLLIYLLPFIISMRKAVYAKNISSLISCITLLLLFLATNITYTYMMLYFLGRGWSNIVKEIKDKKLYKERTKK